MNLKELVGVDPYCRYPDGTVLSHDEFYTKAIEKLGGLGKVIPFIPFELGEIEEALKKDVSLNNLPMKKWDRASGFFDSDSRCDFVGGGIVSLYRSVGVTGFSCSDGVCVLKHAARMWAEREEGRRK